VAAYTGNGAYCFSNALHMSLLAAGADPLALPETWFVECLTAMPFGRVFDADGPRFWINASGWSPERRGLPLAVEALGWRCETWHGGSAEEASARLREALARGPAMLGPLDFGYLSHHRGAAAMAGFDHYVTGLALTDEGLLLHDPAGAPYAVLPVPDLLDAWRADRIGWKLGPYTLRSHFERERSPTREEMIARALPAVRANVHREPARPGSASGHRALRALAGAVRGGPPEALERHLVVFLLPTAARRSVDAARFLAEAGLPAAAAAMGEEAELWGRSCSAASRRDWARAGDLLQQLADAEQELVAAL
jgi:hypothetical protein